MLCLWLFALCCQQRVWNFTLFFRLFIAVNFLFIASKRESLRRWKFFTNFFSHLWVPREQILIFSVDASRRQHMREREFVSVGKSDGWMTSLLASSYALRLLPFPILMCCAVNSLFPLSASAARKSTRNNARSPIQACERHHPASSRLQYFLHFSHVSQLQTHARASSGAIKPNCAIQHGATAVH